MYKKDELTDKYLKILSICATKNLSLSYIHLVLLGITILKFWLYKLICIFFHSLTSENSP